MSRRPPPKLMDIEDEPDSSSSSSPSTPSSSGSSTPSSSGSSTPSTPTITPPLSPRTPPVAPMRRRTPNRRFSPTRRLVPARQRSPARRPSPVRRHSPMRRFSPTRRLSPVRTRGIRQPSPPRSAVAHQPEEIEVRRTLFFTPPPLLRSEVIWMQDEDGNVTRHAMERMEDVRARIDFGVEPLRVLFQRNLSPSCQRK